MSGLVIKQRIYEMFFFLLFLTIKQIYHNSKDSICIVKGYDCNYQKYENLSSYMIT